MNLFSNILFLIVGLMLISFFVAFVGLFFLFKWQNKGKNRKDLKSGVILFFQAMPIWILGFLSFSIFINSARNEFLDIINNEHAVIVFMDRNNSISDLNEISSELKQLKYVVPHSSHSGSGFKLGLITKNGKSYVMVNQDSRRDDEYWVFWDKYYWTKLNEIGRIQDVNFENYLNTN